MRTRKLAWLCALVALASLDARAELPKDVQTALEAIDGVLAAGKARRVEVSARDKSGMGRSLCGTDEPNAEHRDFLCERSDLVGHWVLKDLRADGGERVSAELEARSFKSPGDARAAKEIAVERYGGGPESLSRNGMAWCNLDLAWTEEVLFSLWYTCAVTLRHVKTLQAVRLELLKLGAPFGDARVVGIANNQGERLGLLTNDGRPVPAVPDAQRFRHFVKVTGVAPNDVLWARTSPQRGILGTKVGKLPPDATCVPLALVAPRASREADWAIVKFDGREGWVRRRFITEQPAAECLAAPE